MMSPSVALVYAQKRSCTEQLHLSSTMVALEVARPAVTFALTALVSPTCACIRDPNGIPTTIVRIPNTGALTISGARICWSAVLVSATLSRMRTLERACSRAAASPLALALTATITQTCVYDTSERIKKPLASVVVTKVGAIAGKRINLTVNHKPC